MSAFADLMAESGFPQLLAQLGEPATRHPSGGGSTEPVTIIPKDEYDGGLEETVPSGDVRKRIKTFQVEAAQTVVVGDKWTIFGEGGWTCIGFTDPHEGFRVVTVKTTLRTTNHRSPPRA